MTSKTFSNVYANRLTNNNLHALINSTIVAATAIDPSPFDDLAKAALAHMQTTCNALGQQLNKSLKNPLTTNINTMRNDRLERWNEIKTNLITHKKGRDTTKKEAASAFYFFIEPYWDLGKSPLNTCTDQIKDMFTKYNNNSELVKQAKLMGIDTMLAELATVNAEFDTTYQKRTTLAANKKAPSASKLKTEAVKSYKQFCLLVEQSTNLTPSDTFTTLFSTIDELRKTYALLAPKLIPKTTPKAETQTTTDKAADTTAISAN
jgi:hypothetical protein